MQCLWMMCHILVINWGAFLCSEESENSWTNPHHIAVFPISHNWNDLGTSASISHFKDWGWWWGQCILKPLQCINMFFTIVGQFIWKCLQCVCRSGSTLWLWHSTLRNKGLLPLYPQQQTTEKNQYCWNQYNTQYRHFVSGNSAASQPAGFVG